MLRTAALSLLLLAATPLAAQHDSAPRLARVGYLTTVPAHGDAYYFDAFREELQKLGWEESKNLHVEQRRGPNDRIDKLAAELVNLKVDVLVTDGTPAGRAAKNSTSTIPILLGLTGDPVGSGLVASLSRPGGNITGMSFMNPDLAGKRLELLKEIAPKTKRVAILTNP